MAFTTALTTDRLVRIKQFIKHAQQYRDAVDITENVVLAYGYEGYHWTKKDPWKYTRFHYDETDFQSDADVLFEQTANQIKDFLNHTLVPFFKRLDKAETSMDAARILYQFLESNGVPTTVVLA